MFAAHTTSKLPLSSNGDRAARLARPRHQSSSGLRGRILNPSLQSVQDEFPDGATLPRPTLTLPQFEADKLNEVVLKALCLSLYHF